MQADNHRRSQSGFAAALVGVAIFGLLLRLMVLTAGQGGLATHVHPGYDESVYIGAAWLVRNGSLPYRDYVFVFPPGFLVMLLPVVQLASFFGGPAFAVTLVRVLAACLGALNVWLIGRIGSRWLGPVGGLVAALIYATMPVVVQTEASALQEPFVNLALLLVVIVWAQRTEEEQTRGRLVGAGLLIGVAISMKLVAGVVLVPLLLAGPFVRPAVDRLRLVLAACVPLAVMGATFAVIVGWRPIFEQAIEAQVLRGHDGEGLSRVNSILPMLRGQVGTSTFIGPSAWIAVLLFGAACATAIWRGGRGGRLWGAIGATVLVTLMALPSYYGHYGALLAPAAALIIAWAVTAAVSALSQRHLVPAAMATTLLVALVVVISASQTLVAIDGLPIGLGDFGNHLDQVINDDGPPNAGRVSDAIERIPSAACIVAVRPQILLDVDRLPSADRRGQVLLDVYGSALLAARHDTHRSGDMPGAFAFPAVQADIIRQAGDCDHIVFSGRTCKQGRKDISGATEAKLDIGTQLVTHAGCIQLRRRASSP